MKNLYKEVLVKQTFVSILVAVLLVLWFGGASAQQDDDIPPPDPKATAAFCTLEVLVKGDDTALVAFEKEFLSRKAVRKADCMLKDLDKSKAITDLGLSPNDPRINVYYCSKPHDRTVLVATRVSLQSNVQAMAYVTSLCKCKKALCVDGYMRCSKNPPLCSQSCP